MRVEDLKVGDKMYGCNYPDRMYEVIKGQDSCVYMVIATFDIQDIVRLVPHGTKSTEDYGFFKTRDQMLECRVGKARKAYEKSIQDLGDKNGN